ncbi:MAG: relaxase/mobilization nuclease domain-containing protein [Arcobacter sp.]|nr:relaxase/mobilization nuclease domain-containing protein [Arcobacter sp.]
MKIKNNIDAKLIGKRQKLFDDEILVKKVFHQRDVASKSTYNYKSKNKPSNSKNSKEVLVKITGNSKNLQALKAHIDYITRKDTLDLYADENIMYSGREEIKEFLENFNSNPINKIPNANEISGVGKREAYHIVFSMKEHSKVPEKKLRKAVVKTLKKMYPDNEFALVFHGDTDNPHIHTVLKVKKSFGKRLDIRKNDLANIRRNFAKELNNLGIEAQATIKRNYDKRSSKKNYYEVIDFGKAKYKFSKDENAKDSFYVKYKTKNGTAEIWGEDLERVVSENNLKVGEFAKFKIVDKEPVKVTAYKTKNGQKIKYEKTAHRSKWDCSVQGREKELKEYDSKRYKVKYKIKEINSSIVDFKKIKQEK